MPSFSNYAVLKPNVQRGPQHSLPRVVFLRSEICQRMDSRSCFKRCQQNHLILNTRTLSMEPVSSIYISRAPLPPTLIVFPPFQMLQRDTMLLLSILCLALVGHGVGLKVSTGYQIVHNEQPHGGNYHGFRYLQGPDPYLVG